MEQHALEQTGRARGRTQAASHIEQHGSAWATGAMLRFFAVAAWEDAEIPSGAGVDLESRIFIRAFEAAYQALQPQNAAAGR